MNTKFHLGRLLATPGALDALPDPQQRLTLLRRHASGDWGDVCADDAAVNEAALRNGSRIFSAYQVGEERVWVITEADRSATTILLPNEY